MQAYEQKFAYRSLYTFILGAILGLVSVLLIGDTPLLNETAQWTAMVSSKTYTASYYLLAYAYLIPISGFWAIHRLFSKDKTSFTLSFWGMILAILGSALPMMTMGVAAFAFPAFARISLSQGLNIATVIGDTFSTGTMIFLLFSGLYYLTGLILLGIVLWKEKDRSLRIASIALILHAILIILPEQIIINLLSWLFLLLSAILLISFSKNKIISKV